MTSKEKQKIVELVESAQKRRRRIVYRLAKGMKHPEESPILSRYIVERKAFSLARKLGIGSGKKIQAEAEKTALQWEAENEDWLAKERLYYKAICLYTIFKAIQGDSTMLRKYANEPKMR